MSKWHWELESDDDPDIGAFLVAYRERSRVALYIYTQDDGTFVWQLVTDADDGSTTIEEDDARSLVEAMVAAEAAAESEVRRRRRAAKKRTAPPEVQGSLERKYHVYAAIRPSAEGTAASRPPRGRRRYLPFRHRLLQPRSQGSDPFVDVSHDAGACHLSAREPWRRDVA
jgi:hypothetical protein